VGREVDREEQKQEVIEALARMTPLDRAITVRSPVSRIAPRILLRALLSFFLLAGNPLAIDAAEPALLFSVKTWEGEYASKDVPGGVESTPTRGAIYAVKADGTGLKQIVPFRDRTDFPAASPDGKWVYYQSKKDGGTQVFRCRWDGTGVESLTPPEQLTNQLKGAMDFEVKEAYGYGLSADGKTMVFTVHDGKSGRVVVSNSDGSSPRLLAPHLGYIYMARLSPISDRVVFSGPAKGYRLLLASLPEGKPIELTPDHPECFVPQFSPDGKTIVFIRRDGDVYRVDADGKNLKRLTEGNKYVEFKLSAKDQHGSTDGPDISPDGKRIAFVAKKGDTPNVFVMDIDGSNRKQITSRKTACGRVRWSPDEKQLSFVSFEGKHPQLFVVSADGGEPMQLTKLDGAVYFTNWIGSIHDK
jgi:Tol biopolymer transport system component